jgi:uncharacterized membrane protein
MSATEVEALRGELSKMSDRAAKNSPTNDAASVNLRTDARGRVESIVIRFKQPLSRDEGDQVAEALTEWANDLAGDDGEAA